MADSKTIVREQSSFVVPDLTIKDLLSAIPAHCLKRSAFWSSLYIIYDVLVIAALYKAATLAEGYVKPVLSGHVYSIARFSIWSLYGFGAGLFFLGLWVIAHECGHQAFSESKRINNTVGWFLHSALGVPYHSWRITHGKHHASTGHMTQDQLFVPRTRSQLGLPPFDPNKEDIYGGSVSEEVKKELLEALGDSPIGATIDCAVSFLGGWPAYVLTNITGQLGYPAGTSHFNPSAVFFSPNQYRQVVISDLGVVIWLAGLIGWTYGRGFAEVFRVYLVPYLWVNHWLVLITFLQHTDPLLPHYRPPAFTFPRGALATFDRNLLGDCGKFMGWLGAHASHGISETHVLHHVNSHIPHYYAWEATDALRKKLEEHGIELEGKPGSWAEFYRVFRECKFVEDEGPVVFYKNSQGLAAARPVFCERPVSPISSASDSGVEVDK